MELFKQPNIDWMGKAKYFLALSGFLLLLGGASWVMKGGRQGGLKLGIDFKAGTVVYVRFAQPPDIDKIRAALAAQGLGSSEIQRISDIANPNTNEVVIGLERKGEGDEALDEGKATILKTLNATFGTASSGKPDLNAVPAGALAQFLSRHDPLALGAGAGDRYTQLAKRLTDFRDKDRNGVLTNLDDLRSVEGATPNVISTLKDNYALGSFAVRNVEIVSPKVGKELGKRAIIVTLYALGGMLVYIAFRFPSADIVLIGGLAQKGLLASLLRQMDKVIYGVAAVLAVFHDVLITLGFFSLLNYEISLTVIAALLTLVGYTVNDKIVIFDRIRENKRLLRREPFPDIVNRSINETLSRTMLTGGLTFVSVLILFVIGGQVLRAFSFALVVGIVIGTYSSFGIAAPFVVAWNRWRGLKASVDTGSAAGTKNRSREAATAARLAAPGGR